ncbi:mucin-5AC-like [Thrips palmi]|uniref:Regulatory protein zeste n=1 Tax=Thrips palmi TaxID=161013 RepID=A0A6P8Y028_THRPL|nr:mucin-5AC-like [Thrips palmi]
MRWLIGKIRKPSLGKRSIGLSASMAQRATAEQKRFLVSYMERHPAFCQREFASPQGAVLIRQTWERLANMLNEVEDGANKSTDQWMRYWTDQKKTVKARAAQVYRALGRGTGGGPALDVHLTSYELRVLTCMGGWVRISGFADIVDPLEVDPMQFDPRPRFAQPQPTNQRFNPPAHRLALAQRQFAEAQQRLAQAQEQLDQAQPPQRPQPLQRPQPPQPLQRPQPPQPLQRPQPPQPPQLFKRMRTDVQVEEPQEPHEPTVDMNWVEPQEPHEPTVDMNWVLDEDASPSTFTDLGSATSDFWSVVQSSPSAGQTETVKTTFPASSSVQPSTAPFQQYQHSLSVMQPSQVPASSGKFISLQPNTFAGPVRTSDLAASSFKTTAMKSTVPLVKPPTVQQYQRSLPVLEPSQAQVPASSGTSASLPTSKLIAVQPSTSAGQQTVKKTGVAAAAVKSTVVQPAKPPTTVNFQQQRSLSILQPSRKLITLQPNISAGQSAAMCLKSTGQPSTSASLPTSKLIAVQPSTSASLPTSKLIAVQPSTSASLPTSKLIAVQPSTSASLPTSKLIAAQPSTSAGQQTVKTAGPASTSLKRAVTVQQVQPSSRTPASASTVKLITVLPHTSAGQPAKTSVPTAPPVRSSNTVQLAQSPPVLISGLPWSSSLNGKKLKSPPVATSTPIKDGLQYIVLRSPLSCDIPTNGVPVCKDSQSCNLRHQA